MTLHLRAKMLEETSIRGRRARIPWACGYEAAKNSQTFCLTGPDSRKLCAWQQRITEGRPSLKDRPRKLLRFPPLLLAQSLPRKRFFGPALFTGLHVETMLLDLLDDVFLLHFALEAPQCIFKGFILLDNDFCHLKIHPQSGLDWKNSRASFCGYASVSLGHRPCSQLSHELAVRRRTLKYRWLFLIQFAHSRQAIFAKFKQSCRY